MRATRQKNPFRPPKSQRLRRSKWISKVKSEIELESDDWNEKSFDDDLIGDDLDVPGSEDDDEDEMIGREDEENNYYSLGGDNHDNLEENQGD